MQRNELMTRQNYSSGALWESKFGYSRAVRIGNVIEVSGTVAVDGDLLVGHGDAYQQARFILQKIKRSLESAGASLDDVIRTRVYVTDIKNWELVAAAHLEFFGKITPATTMVQVSALIDSSYLVEIEATAIIE